MQIRNQSGNYLFIYLHRDEIVILCLVPVSTSPAPTARKSDLFRIKTVRSSH
jgi:hypothetical protein